MLESIAIQKVQRRRAAIASVVGTTIEWYDFFLYGAVAALVFNKLFFTSLDPLTGTIAAFGTFAAGFLIRPFGAVFFGSLGDRKGRRHALMATLVVMGVATVGIGFLPTYERVGLLAPALLMVLRLLQGFAAGGEWGGAVLLTFENSGKNGRGLMASLPGMGVGIGSLLSTGSVALLMAVLSEDDFLSWGWRVPFLASSIIIVVGIYMRLALTETPEFEQSRQEGQNVKTPLRQLFRGYWRELLVVIGVRLGENGGYYLLGTFVVAYAVHVGADSAIVLAAISLTFALTIVTIPIFGWLSDRIGRITVYAFGASVLMVWSWVFFRFIETNNPALIFLAILVGLIFGYSAMFGAQSALIAELFDVKVRYTGLALGHSLGAILGGGLAPLIAAALLSVPEIGRELVAGYASCMGLLTLLTLIVSRRLLNKKKSSGNSNTDEKFEYA